MATSAKTSKPAKTLKAPLSATPKAAPRTLAKAKVKAAAAVRPKPPKSEAVVKQTAGAEPKAKPVETKAAAKVKSTILSAEHRRRYVELAAFYIAERRGFSGGNTLEDWLRAEAEIDQLLQQGKINR